MMLTNRKFILPFLFLIVVSAAIFAFFLFSSSPPSQYQFKKDAQYFIDEKTCISCHAHEYQDWMKSHHYLAMQVATNETVLGNFNQATFTYGKITSTFFKRNGKFYVNTDGPDGKLADFEVKYVIGVEPLQQYIIELPGQHFQTLSIAWEPKPKRWFHLYPNEKIDFQDELHWTKPSQNWNMMCAECHTTGLKKNYSLETNTYHTTWDMFTVGCQACHGPAELHLEWAKRRNKNKAQFKNTYKGFAIDLNAADNKVQVEACAPCHARRSTLNENNHQGKRFLDHHLPALLIQRLYFPDGQIQDEDYEYGSFIQSKMYEKGVRCSDCHQPHTLELKAPGNLLCVSCHNPTGPAGRKNIDTSGLKLKNYDSPSHHFHPMNSEGAKCVSCHAPTRNYMVVDPRHDHSFRIPRPDLTIAIGTPNACNGCHQDKTPEWAVEQIEKWHGSKRSASDHYGKAIFDGREGKSGAVNGLMGLINNNQQMPIVRATALDLLSQYPSRQMIDSHVAHLPDPEPLVRRTAVVGLEMLSPAERVEILLPLLNDPVLAVRIEAARLLAPSQNALKDHQLILLKQALAEYETSQLENADRPEALVNLGDLYRSMQEYAKAENYYRKAISYHVAYVPAYVNLSDLYRERNMTTESVAILQEGLKAAPNHPTLYLSLSFALIREGNKSEAYAMLSKAYELAPNESQFAYAYALALQDQGKMKEAIAILEKNAKQQNDREVLLALASLKKAAGDEQGALNYLNRLREINPHDPALK
ncbi:MAG: tetratricopeptide repeat protein [Candidatus Berkiellales bacterium]